MTKEERKDKRAARHQVQEALRRIVKRSVGLYSTPSQERAALKVMTARFYKEQVTPAAKRIEAQVVGEARRRQETTR